MDQINYTCEQSIYVIYDILCLHHSLIGVSLTIADQRQVSSKVISSDAPTFTIRASLMTIFEKTSAQANLNLNSLIYKIGCKRNYYFVSVFLLYDVPVRR